MVLNGFGQKKGIYFYEIFSLIVKMSSILVVLSFATSSNLEIEQINVKIAFLHRELMEEIYMDN